MPDKKNPQTVVAAVVPRLVAARNRPLAKSGAFGAAVVIQY